jgi:hypothetical protein
MREVGARRAHHSFECRGLVFVRVGRQKELVSLAAFPGLRLEKEKARKEANKKPG